MSTAKLKPACNKVVGTWQHSIGTSPAKGFGTMRSHCNPSPAHNLLRVAWAKVEWVSEVSESEASESEASEVWESLQVESHHSSA